MAVVNGDTVKVHYTGTFDNDEVFDSSKGREPLAFKTGAGMMIQGFDEAVIGMEVGDVKTVTLEPSQAYGERSDDHVVDMPKEQVPEDIDLQVGLQLQLQDNQGHIIPVTVTSVGDETVTLDANHPLAGKSLTFEIELVEVGCELPSHEGCCGGHDHDHGEGCGGGGGCC